MIVQSVLTFDIDTFDDPTHGQQQLTFFHGYSEQFPYQPRAITCAENDATVMVCLLHGTASAALGAEDDRELLVRLRRAAGDPPPENLAVELPAEALAGKKRRDFHNRRRAQDPLGEGQPCTWRTRLIKVAAPILVTSRRVVVRLSGCRPCLAHYRHLAAIALGTPAVMPPKSG